MDTPFFVMLYHPNTGYTPMTGEDDDIARFESKETAREAAEHCTLGAAYGFEIFEIGDGCA